MIASSLIDLVHSSRKACLLASGAVAAFLASALPSHAQLPSGFVNFTTANGLASNSVNDVHETDGIIYAATSGGVSISTNGGANWTNYTTANGLGNNAIFGVYASGSTIYAATDNGVSISSNGGTSWTNYTTANGLAGDKINDVYASGSTIYAATLNGVSISTNGGANWTNYTYANGLGRNYVLGVYETAGTIYAATNNGVSISTNGGANWTNYTTANVQGNNTIFSVYASGSSIYATTNSGVSISTNGGANWTNYTTANGLGSGSVYDVFASGSTLYAATSGGLSISTNGGANWTNYTDANGLGNNFTRGVFARGGTIYVANVYGVSLGFVPLTLTASTSNITSTSAALLSEFTYPGNSPVTARGFVYALASVSEPRIGDAGVTQVADSGSGIGSYSKLLSGLSPNTAYVVRSYAVNSGGTTYSPVQSFSTNQAPAIVSQGGNANVALDVIESFTAVSTVSATDADAGQTITYSVSGGADAARFTIDSASGVLTFAAAPDYEAPVDANTDNIYEVVVAATDNGSPPKSATQALTITVMPNQAPTLVSHGGIANVALSRPEHSTAVSTVNATDTDTWKTITYSISGGADAARFTIDSTSGVVTFVAKPDFEAPADANADNVYEVIVAATDNGSPPKSATQTFTVTVTDDVIRASYASTSQVKAGVISGTNFTIGSVGTTSGLWQEIYTGIGGDAVSSLTSSAKFPNSPDSKARITSAASTANYGDFYGQRWTGWITPAVTGNYRFYLASDDSSEIWLGTGDQPASAVRILELSGWTNEKQWSARSPSAWKSLTAGVRYYIEVRHKENNVGDHCALAWQREGDSAPVDGSGQIPGSFLSHRTSGANTSANNWPTLEGPDKAVDGDPATRFLLFSNTNAGLILSPSNSTLAFNQLSFYTANNASERDPASYVIYGSNTELQGSSGTNLPLSGLTQIASGSLSLPDNRENGPTVVQFANTTAYKSYLIVFPTVRSTANNIITHISEVQLAQTSNLPNFVAMTGARGGQLSSGTFTLGSIGSSNPGTNWDSGNSPDRAIDGSPDTKFLINRSSGAGLIANPQAGPARINQLSFWTANDFEERDPLSYEVYGFATAITARSGALSLGSGATLLGSGSLSLPSDRFFGPQTVVFNNSTAYGSYLVVFPTVKNSPSTTMTQISEVQFSYNGTPDFAIPAPVLSLNENLGAQSYAAFVTGITPGIGDVDQTVSFSSTNDNNALFSVQPAISADGTLTFTTAPDSYGNATVSVVGTDNFGRSSAPRTFRIEVAIVAAISSSANSLGNFDTVAGSASGSQSFTLNGRALAGPITLTAPAGYEISTNNTTFSSTLQVNNPGTIQSVYRGAFGNSTTASGKIWIVGTGSEFPNNDAFAALKSDGSVVTWGNPSTGGNSTAVASSLSSNVTAVYSTSQAFAALKADGSVVTWGNPGTGGDSTAVASSLTSGVTAVYSNNNAFAALKADGSVVTWGFSSLGGDSSAVASSLSSGVTAVYSNARAFAALKADGSVVTWGDATYGGNSTAVASNLASNVTAVYSTQLAFAALKTDGSLVTWGYAAEGGNSASVASSLSSGITAVYSNRKAFAALKSDGSVITWGDSAHGGDSTAVTSSLSSNVTAVYSHLTAFAALKSDGSVVTWGNASYGGDSTAVASSLSSGVTRVYSNQFAFAALKSNGSVVTWGGAAEGGDSASVASSLSSNVTAVYSTRSGFAALKADGSVVTWGFAGDGGDSTAVASKLRSGVVKVYSNFFAFAALKTDGSVVTWGAASFGGSGGPANIGAGVPIPATIYTRLSPTAPTGSVSGNITLTSSGAQTQTIALSGTVVLPSVSPSVNTLGNFSTAADTASGSQSFTVNGRGLTGPVTLTAPAGYEISTDNTTFGSTLQVNKPAGTIQSVYRGAFGRSTTASGKVWNTGSGSEFSNQAAFAALKTDGSVVTWGNSAVGGDSSSVASSLGSNVTALFSTTQAFAALKGDGSVVTWGNVSTGGDSTSVASSLSSGVTTVYSNASAFAALKGDGSVITWGPAQVGGSSSAVASKLSSNVTAVYSTLSAFAALKSDGSVVTWGGQYDGGTSTSVASQISSNVTAVYSNAYAFAALKADGSVVTWGGSTLGGSSSAVASSLSSNVTAVYSTASAFAALKADGSVVTWGSAGSGGNSSSVASRLSSNVTAVHSNGNAFAALKTDGSVVTWGNASLGGDSSAVASSLSSNVTAVYSNQAAFAALKSDGSVVTWGRSWSGGDSTSVAGVLSSNVTAVYSNQDAFAALKADGSVVTWGLAAKGGDSTAVASSLSSGVTKVYSTASAFAALKSDGSVVTWGESSAGGTGGPANIGAAVTIPATIYTRLSSTAPAGSVSGNITLTSSGVQTQTVALSGTVAPSISPSVNTLGNFSTAVGSASGSQSLTLNGRGLTGPITLTAPAGYEISTDNTTFSSTLQVNKTAGTIQSVYRGVFGNYTTASGSIWYTGSGSEFPNLSAFAALKGDGSVVTWGNASSGGDSTSVASSLSSNVTAVYSTYYAFAARKSDGSVVTWGNASKGGDSTSVASSLSSNITAVYSTGNAFAALKTDGSVVTWGDPNYGGDSSAVAGSLTSDVTAVYSNSAAFAALKADGSVVTWGSAAGGGNSFSVASRLSSNVTAVYSNEAAFAALKTDGSVVTWGSTAGGGNSTSVASSLSSNVRAVYSNQVAFAALKADGSVITWGGAADGGDSTSVASSLSSNVTAVYATLRAFTALKSDGSVVTWGDSRYGGDSAPVASSLSSNVTAVYSTYYAFAALKSDGSVVTWGRSGTGGDSTAVASSLNSNVTAVYSSPFAFAALKSDGSVVTWGLADYGGNSTSVASSLSANVTAVYTTERAFAALKSDGSVVTWGSSSYGGSGGPTNIGAAAPIPATIYTRLSSTAPVGSVSGNITLTSSGAQTRTVALSGTVTDGPTYTHQELWRFTNFGSYTSDASAADSADPDGDGLSNLMEYALGTGPNSSGVIPAVLALNGANLEYTYTRSTAAKDNGVTYQIEWSDTLEAGSWSTETVTQQITSTQEALETVKASVPKGNGGKRFLRLRVGAPVGDQ